MKTNAGVVLVSGLCFLFTAALLSAGETGLPGVRELGSLSDQYSAVTFDHPKHAAMAESCGACHHHADAASCKECHALSPSDFKGALTGSFMACSVCHGDYDRENAAMPGLKVAYHKKCFDCHRGMGDLGLDPKGCTEMCHARKAVQ